MLCPLYYELAQKQGSEWLSLLLRPKQLTHLGSLFIGMAKEYLWIEGLPFLTATVRDLRSLRDEFVVKDEDVIILSYPKSGKDSESAIEEVVEGGDYTMLW